MTDDNDSKIYDKLMEITEGLVELKTDMKYVKKHVGVMNDELGQCVVRLNKIEQTHTVETTEKKVTKKHIALITGIVCGVPSLVTFLYWVLKVLGIVS